MCKGSLKKAKYLKCVLVVLVGYTIFILVPAVIFRHFEGWSLGESVYFAMVTLTTIGFGDFIAGERTRWLQWGNSRLSQLDFCWVGG